MEQQKQILRTIIDEIYPLDTVAFDLLFSKCFIKQYKKGKLLLQAGEQDQQFRLIINGLVKSYRIIDDGKKEGINWIVNEGGVACSVVSLFKQIPSIEYLETIDDTELICINFLDLDKLIEEQTSICKLIGKWMMDFLLKYDKRVDIYRHAKPEQRLEIFMKAQPQLINRLSKKEIASYLDIAPGTLSAAFHKL